MGTANFIQLAEAITLAAKKQILKIAANSPKLVVFPLAFLNTVAAAAASVLL